MLVTLPQTVFNFSMSTRQLACHGTKGLLQTYIGEHDVFIQRMEGNELELHVVTPYDPQSPVILECFSEDCIVMRTNPSSLDSLSCRVLDLLSYAEFLHSVSDCLLFGPRSHEGKSFRPSFRLP